MAELFGFDCYSPKEIAERVENVGVTKSRLPLLPVVALVVFGGAGIVGLVDYVIHRRQAAPLPASK